MKKKILISLLVVLLLVCAVAVGVFADGSAGAEETFRVYKANLTLGVDLRFNIKVQTGALPEGASEVKLLVWEGAQDGVDYTQATTETEGYTELTNPITDENGLLVFTYNGITAAEMGKTIYLRAYYNDGTQDVYTEAKRYSMAQYLHSIYKAEGTTEKENKVIETLFAYGDAAQELGNEGEPLPKISDGVVKITVSGGKFADGFTCGKFLSGEKLNVAADGTESAPMLTAELGEGWLWTMADGKLSYEAEAEYYDGIYIGKYENAFEVTVGENTEIHTDKTLAEVLELANGGTVKLLADVDMGKYNINVVGVTITLDLNGKNIISDYLFNIYDATLTVKDSVGGGSVTTTSETVFYLNVESSVLTIEGGTFTGATYAVYVGGGTATINGGTFKGNLHCGSGSTLSITGGTFTGENNAVYVQYGTATITGGTFTGKNNAVQVNGGTATISGGTFTDVCVESGTAEISGGTFTDEIHVSAGEVQIKDGTFTSVFVEGGKATITGGTFTGEGNHYAVCVSGGTAEISGGTFTGKTYAVYVNGSEVTISGGTFTSEEKVVYVESDGKLTISDGTFTSGKKEDYVGSGTLSIKGGTFNFDPSSVIGIEFNSGSYSVDYNDDGTWTVKKSSAV